jgi:hypothetical protein
LDCVLHTESELTSLDQHTSRHGRKFDFKKIEPRDVIVKSIFKTQKKTT